MFASKDTAYSNEAHLRGATTLINNDIQHNDTEHNDTEHNDTKHDIKVIATLSITIRSIMTLNTFMLSVANKPTKLSVFC